MLTESGAHVHGLRVDYLLPKFWAIDVVIWALIVLWFVEEKHNRFKTLKKWKKSLTRQPKELLALTSILLTLFVVRQFMAEHALIALWTLLSWVKFGLLAAVLYQKRQLVDQAITFKVLAVTVLFQSLVALWQCFTQQSLGGYLFLGETNLSDFAGLAKTSWGGIEQVLPYGTTAHPNVLGGFLSLSLLLLLPFCKTRKDPFVKVAIGLCMGIGLLALILTQSMSAWFALGLGLTLIFWKPLLIKLPSRFVVGGIFVVFLLSVWLPLPGDSLSISRRQYLNQSAIRMSIDHPFFGVGVQNFTSQVEKYSPTKEVVRFVQPAHNALILLLAETGLLGLILGFILIKKLTTHTDYFALVPLLPIVFLDHYVLTIQSGMVLLLFYVIHNQE